MATTRKSSKQFSKGRFFRAGIFASLGLALALGGIPAIAHANEAENIADQAREIARDVTGDNAARKANELSKLVGVPVPITENGTVKVIDTETLATLCGKDGITAGMARAYALLAKELANANGKTGPTSNSYVFVNDGSGKWTKVDGNEVWQYVDEDTAKLLKEMSGVNFGDLALDGNAH